MAKPFAIAAVGRAILALLSTACPRDANGFPNAHFELVQAANFGANAMPEGIGLYLYRLTPANNIRNQPARLGPDGRRYRPSFSVDLHYLLIAFASDAFKQQRLLGWAVRTIEDTPVLPASLINTIGPEHDLFAPTEAVDVIMETLSVQDLTSVWEVGKPAIQPSAPYVVRMLNVDSDLEITEHAPVQTRVFEAGKVVEP
jgi:hypothetical protein